MAAPTNKPSPSNRVVDETIDATVAVKDNATANDGKKEDPATVSPAATKQEAAPADSAATKNPTEAVDSLPTYQSSETSAEYLLAKRHLNEGKFDEAMTVCEGAIKSTMQLLRELSGAGSDEDFTLHESMAPYHYLYGTTLLYSIEEADHDVTTAGTAVSTAVVDGEAAAVPEEAAPAAEKTVSDPDEDFEIAWENLDTARNIISKMPVTEKLELDLAQIFLRAGDLQRLNGRDDSAIQDYESCLRLRKKSPFLTMYDRKIADVHYQLGLTYISVASINRKGNNDEEEHANKPELSDIEEKVLEAKQAMARSKAAFHYLECCKCFSGLLATICNADPATLIENLGGGDNNATEAGYKTTGEEDDDVELPQVASAKLRTLRKRASELVTASTTNLTADQKADVDDFCDMMEDIQEVVNEAETASKAVKEASKLKEAAYAATNDAADEKQKSDDTGANTTIGFGTASAGVAVAAAPAANSQAARPMMVVKKKKKRAPVQPAEATDSKKPKTE